MGIESSSINDDPVISKAISLEARRNLHRLSNCVLVLPNSGVSLEKMLPYSFLGKRMG